jgi:hypothetical protein
MEKQNAKTQISDVNAKMRKSDRCDAIELPNSANAMRMRKRIRITSPGRWTILGKNLVWKISDSFQILVEDLGWKPWIGKEIFRIWGRFSSTSGRRTTQNPETLWNARSYPRFFRIQKLDPTRSEFT